MKIKNLLILIVILINSFSVLGFGATQPNTVVIAPGESQIVEFSVQNGGGAVDDVNAVLEIQEGQDIIELIEDNKYFIEAGGETTAKIKINIPKNANEDDKWNVRISFKATPVKGTEELSMVDLGYGVLIKFDVVAKELVKTEIPTGSAVRDVSSSSMYFFIILIIIIAVLYILNKKGLLLRRKKENIKVEKVKTKRKSSIRKKTSKKRR